MNVKKMRLFRPSGILGFATALAVVGGCASAGQVSTQQEEQIGAQEAAQINQQIPLVQDAAINSYINQLGRSIAQRADPRGIPYTFRVVNSDVVNAFSIPGGYVYVDRGLISHTKNMSELAGVLAHEIGHVVERHGIEQMANAQNANTALGLGTLIADVLLGQGAAQATQTLGQVGGTAVLAKYSRQDEEEADLDAVRYLIHSGIDPHGLVTMFQTLLQEEQSNPGAVAQWFATHPTTQDRITYVQSAINQYSASQLRGLSVQSQAYERMKQRLAQLPPAPPSRQ